MDIVFYSEAESAKDFLRAKALFILKIRDERKLPQENAILKHITVIIIINTTTKIRSEKQSDISI